MTIRMQHPEHGWHEATPFEVPSMLAHGWTECTPLTETPVIAEIAGYTPARISPISETETLHLPEAKRKPGRPKLNKDDPRGNRTKPD